MDEVKHSDSIFSVYKMVTSGSEYQGRDTEWFTPKSKII